MSTTDNSGVTDGLHVEVNPDTVEPNPDARGPDDEEWSPEARAARGAGPKE